MNCDAVRPYLLDFANEETGPLRSWAIRRHLAHCPACTEELAAQRRLTAVLRCADLVSPENAPASVPTRRVPLRRVLALATAIVFIGALLVLPTLYQSRRAAQNPGAAIAAALERVNTWHLSGWKLIDGKQVSWEVWGRRRPFLYYERVGDLVTWDDGKQRLRVFPPNAAFHRPGGLVIKTTVTQTTAPVGFQDDPAYQLLADDQTNRGRFGDGATTLYAQTPQVAKFRRQWFRGMSGVNENKLYTISKRTWLPTTYQLHFDNRKFERDSELLKVNYDVEMPDDITTPPPSTGYSVVDFTQPGEAAMPGENIVSHHSLSVQATVLALDKEGNILIDVHGWLGKNPLTADSTFTLNIGTEGSSPDSEPIGEKGSQKIKYLTLADGGFAPGANFYLPYGPLEPVANTQDLPDTFHLSLSASPELQVRDSDMFLENGEALPNTQSESLFTDNFQWQLTLPHQPLRSFAEAIPSAETRKYNLLPGGPLPESLRRSVPFLLSYKLAEQRRIYYYLGSDYQFAVYKKFAPRLVQTGLLYENSVLNLNTVTKQHQLSELVSKLETVYKEHATGFRVAEQKFRGRAAYWQKKKLEMLPVGGNTHEDREMLLQRRLQDTFLLAICYQKAGDKAGCDQTLRQLIGDCEKAGQQKDTLCLQAKYARRTGQFPSDADYKGPS